MKKDRDSGGRIHQGPERRTAPSRTGERYRTIRVLLAIATVILAALGMTALAVPRLTASDSLDGEVNISVDPPTDVKSIQTFRQITLVTLFEHRDFAQETGLSQDRTPYVRIAIGFVAYPNTVPEDVEGLSWHVWVPRNAIAQRDVTLTGEAFTESETENRVVPDYGTATEWVSAMDGSVDAYPPLRLYKSETIWWYFAVVDVAFEAPEVSQSMVDGRWVTGWDINWIPTKAASDLEGTTTLAVCRHCDIAEAYGAHEDQRESIRWSDEVSQIQTISVDTPWRPWAFTEPALWVIIGGLVAGILGLPASVWLQRRNEESSGQSSRDS